MGPISPRSLVHLYWHVGTALIGQVLTRGYGPPRTGTGSSEQGPSSSRARSAITSSAQVRARYSKSKSFEERADA
eukprot:1420530-Rhodomonas_salina.2